MQLDEVLAEIKQGDVSLDELSDFYRRLKKIVLNRRKALAVKAPIPEVLLRRTAFKVKLSKVAPPEARERLHRDHERCVLAVSLETDKFEGEKLESLLGWIDSRFERCLVVVADSLYRLTLQMTDDVPADEAVSGAREKAQAWVEDSQPLFDRFDDSRFRVSFISELEDHPRRIPVEKAVRRLYDRDRAFRQSVNLFARTYTSRMLAGRDIDPEALEAKMRIGREYLIQEMGYFGALAGEKWGVICYPGNVNTFVDVANGRFDGVPSVFKNLVYCALSIKKRGIRFQDEPEDDEVFRPAQGRRRA
ncbi:MAG: tRNA-dependent cyclodipeptide synthase [bacterium]|nr:tRNA-dependent cyclodipeptide synthase [bacterium]